MPRVKRKMERQSTKFKKLRSDLAEDQEESWEMEIDGPAAMVLEGLMEHIEELETMLRFVVYGQIAHAKLRGDKLEQEQKLARMEQAGGDARKREESIRRVKKSVEEIDKEMEEIEEAWQMVIEMVMERDIEQGEFTIPQA